jgi:hypothetical protein
MKDNFKRYDESIKAKKTLIEQRTQQVNDPKYAANEREAIQKEITKLNRELEDMNNDMKKFINEQNDKQMVTIYKEIQEAAARYALGHNLDMVLTHIDAVNPTDFFNPMNVMGKMQQRACMPLYYDKSLDVSKDIADALNASYNANRAAPTSTPTTPTPTPH